MFFCALVGRRGKDLLRKLNLDSRRDSRVVNRSPNTLEAEGEGQEAALATRTQLKSDPMYILLGTSVPEPPSLLLQETLNSTSPIYLQPPKMD